MRHKVRDAFLTAGGFLLAAVCLSLFVGLFSNCGYHDDTPFEEVAASYSDDEIALYISERCADDGVFRDAVLQHLGATTLYDTLVGDVGYEDVLWYLADDVSVNDLRRMLDKIQRSQQKGGSP